MSEGFGPYEVVAAVSEGSLGRIYKARHTELDRIAAVKELAPAVRDVPGQLDRLRGEATTLAALDHPNIVALYDYTEEPDRAWLAEQWVDGATLTAILAEHGTLSPEQALGVIKGAVTGLAHAHTHGVVHRDISAANILADQQGTSMLVDFGVAAPTGVGTASGTPAFLSPEAARGEPLTPASDVYSVAALTYLLLTGHPVFTGTATEVVKQHLDTPAPRLAGHGADLADLLRRSLSKNPADRPADAAAFLTELEQAATRRYGATWLDRASIAGFVGGAAAAGIAAATAGGGAASIVVVDTAVAGTAGTADATAHAGVAAKAAATGTKLWIGGTAATAIAAAAVAFVVTRSEAVPAPVGDWNVEWTFTESNNPAFVQLGGDVDGEATYTFPDDCGSKVPCRGTFEGQGGHRAKFVWNGRTLTLTFPPSVSEGPCFEADGDAAPGSNVKQTTTFSKLRLTPKGDRDGRPARYEGSMTSTVTVSNMRGGCTNTYGSTGSETPEATADYVLTPEE